MKSDLDSRLIKCLARVLEMKPLEINSNSSMDTLPAWDSLNHLKLILELEKEFEISFNNEETMNLISLPAIRKAVKKHLK
jgi:acyl carrier protein